MSYLKQIFFDDVPNYDDIYDDLSNVISGNVEDVIFYGIRIIPWKGIPDFLKVLHNHKIDLTDVMGVISSNMSDEYRQPTESDSCSVLYRSALFLASVGYDIPNDPRLNGEDWPDDYFTAILEAKRLGKIEYETTELLSVVCEISPVSNRRRL